MLLFNGKESNPRSFLKAISWRTLGSIDTFILGMLFTSNLKAAGAIASTEVITKIFLYYFHERVWAQVSWGLPVLPPTQEAVAARPAEPAETTSPLA
ncbi:putative membrane protein [Sphingobium fontiphilum]|uniref:Putative membrane protein n=1 Tax=Sphingobium fontiphilum TaxID=944425 RepID=A0A7W6GNU8_9SPHN|nr:DUF2061 domain-containing protein [Sphingobium fontiphilum]MBB3982190.1 putative membrane protein [Sphingobium fontiphilum]